MPRRVAFDCSVPKWKSLGSTFRCLRRSFRPSGGLNGTREFLTCPQHGSNSVANSPAPSIDRINSVAAVTELGPTSRHRDWNPVLRGSRPANGRRVRSSSFLHRDFTRLISQNAVGATVE
jgi:hypothetical protein